MRANLKIATLVLSIAVFLSACLERNTLEKANNLYREGKYDEALTVYGAILKKKPDEITALKAVSDIKLIKKDFDGAIEGYKKLIETDPMRRGVGDMVSMLSYSKNIRDKAADTIRDMGGGRTEVINEILAQISSGNNYVKIDYLSVLARIGNSASFAAGAVAGYLENEYFGVRKAALEALGTFDAGKLKEADAIRKIVKCLNDENISVAEQAVQTLGLLKSGANETVPDLIKMLAKHDMKDLAKKALAEIGTGAKSTVPELIALTDDRKPAEIRIAAMDSLGAIGSAANDAVPVLIPFIYEKDTIIKTASANALTKIGKASNEAIPQLIKLLKHKDANVRLRAISELSDLGKAAGLALAPLSKLSKDINKEVREEAKKAFEKIEQAKR